MTDPATSRQDTPGDVTLPTSPATLLARLDALLAGDGGGGTASPAAVLEDVRGAKAARAGGLGALGPWTGLACTASGCLVPA